MRGQPSLSASQKPEKHPVLQVSDLTFLQQGPYNFTVCEGECVGLSGASGVGKSQLLRAIADLVPSQGSITLGGRDKDEFAAPLWRKIITMVPATPVWWYDLVGDHFPEINSEIGSLVNELGFDHEVYNWEVSRLSTGEKQRLGLIRALVGKPQVLLLDEPTSALDSLHTAKVENLIYSLRTEMNMALIWVSHDREQLERVAQRVFSVKQDALELIAS